MTLAEESTGWNESSNSAWDDQGPPAYQDQDYAYIQGSYSVTADTTKTGVGTLLWDYGSTFTIPTDGAMLIWLNFYNPNALASYANGGLRAIIGSGLGTFWSWDVGGSDFGSYPYGGWQNFAVNDTISPDDTVNSYAGGSHQIVGGGCNVVTGIGKGESFQVDAIRYGRCSSIFEYGESGDYADFAGFAAANDAQSARWGLIQAISGGYLYKGKMTLGTVSNAVNFEDADTLVLIDNTPKVTANFNTIEVNNASSWVSMDNIIFRALGTQSPGRWVTNANADLDINACQFISMGAFTFGGTNSTFTNCIWRGCGLITVDGGTLNGSSVLESTVAADASAIEWDVNTDPDGYLDNLTISKGSNDHHAIEFGDTVPSTMTIRGLDASGFSSSDSQNSSTFYFADTAGTITLNCVGCTGNMTYKSAGATINIVEDPVTVQVTVKTTAGVVVENARVLVAASDGTGPFPFEETVTIVNSGTTATVTHNSHGMASNDYVVIEGASHEENNGIFQITYSDANTYTYTMSSAPGSSPTGTITSTFVALYGLSNASGIVSTSRVYSSDQNVTGWARKSSSTPRYRQGPIAETVDSTDGMTTTAILSLDE